MVMMMMISASLKFSHGHFFHKKAFSLLENKSVEKNPKINLIFLGLKWKDSQLFPT